MSETDDELPSDVLDVLALGLPSAGPPGGHVRQRLFDLVSGRDRFLPFLDRMMKIFDLPENRAEAELHSIDDAAAWEDMVPGVRYRDFEGGEAVGDAHGGLVRVRPGTSFPHHRHVGEETLLVLQGEIEDDQGRRYRAGDIITSADGTGHELRAVGEQETIYAALVVALEFGDGDDELDDDDDELDD